MAPTRPPRARGWRGALFGYEHRRHAVLPWPAFRRRLAVNTALAQIYRGGAIKEIFGRWFGAFGRPGPLMEATFLFGALPE